MTGLQGAPRDEERHDRGDDRDVRGDDEVLERDVEGRVARGIGEEPGEERGREKREQDDGERSAERHGRSLGAARCRSGSAGGDGLDLGDELAQVERFLDHVGGVHLARVILEVARRREQDDRYVLVSRLQLVRELPAVHDRHHEIEDDDVRAERPQQAERLFAIGGRDDLEPLIGERGEEKLPKIGIVVDHHDAFPGHQRRDSVPQEWPVAGQASWVYSALTFRSDAAKAAGITRKPTAKSATHRKKGSRWHVVAPGQARQRRGSWGRKSGGRVSRVRGSPVGKALGGGLVGGRSPPERYRYVVHHFCRKYRTASRMKVVTKTM